MKLLELLTSAWAIEPAKLIEMQAIYATHMRGEKIDIAAIEARMGRPLASEQQKYSIQDGGVAVLPIEGVLAPKANLLMQISGGASTQMLTTQVQSAMADSRVKSIILAIDSPGGSVFGTPELAAVIREAAAIKPIVAVTDATMASAAYWIGSAANAIYITGPTVNVGSIGVVARHSYEPSAGQVTEVTAGRYKRAVSGDKPLDKQGLAYMQSQVDHLYEVFVGVVADNRKASIEQVLEHMADGRVFIGQQAIDRGLVDGFSTVDAMAEQLASNPAKFASRRKAQFAMPKPAGVQAAATPAAQAAIHPTEPVLLTPVINSKESTMDMKELKEQHPALFAQIETETAAAVAFATTVGAAAGSTAEAARISGVRATALPGHEALVEVLAFDGKTTPAEAALAVNAAHRASLATAAAAHMADAPKALPHAAAPSDTPALTAQQIAKNAVALHSGQRT